MNKEAREIYINSFEEELEKIGLRASTVRRALIKRLWQVGSRPGSGVTRKGAYYMTSPLLKQLKMLGNKSLYVPAKPYMVASPKMQVWNKARAWLRTLRKGYHEYDIGL